ncbi:nuclear transport factor 2 family protein [Cytobacillus sp. IB215665]|uniref:YybH family protein n=1 Tax=Cytobacillus sp. IB215665 TaxID=3097357 RepID=UPI002A0B7431|nr:nuclear transport factor 2 family protein [Cytobacillus sp. IB215665]MDX8366449.1 nuclear transport factor 2 family protein [Cytobacillus sp. IB215665]
MSYQQALQKYIEATNSHDFNNVKKVLHENAVYWFTNKSCVTLEEIHNYFENAWHTIKDEVYAAKDVEWIAVDQKTATCIYTYHYEGYYNGKFVTGSGRATNIFVKNNDYDDWKLIHEHLSSL